MTSKQIKENKQKQEKAIEQVLTEAGYIRNENMYQDYKSGIVATVYWTHSVYKKKMIAFDYARGNIGFEKNVTKGELQYICNSIFKKMQ